MPNWLFWTFVGLAAWFLVSIVVALLVANLIFRRREAGQRVVVLAGPASMRLGGRGLRRVS